MGSKVVGRGSVFFQDVKVPDEWRIGGEGEGFPHGHAGFRLQPRTDWPASAGPAGASLEETWRYITERQAFGHPLARYQA